MASLRYAFSSSSSVIIMLKTSASESCKSLSARVVASLISYVQVSSLVPDNGEGNALTSSRFTVAERAVFGI